MFPFYQLIQNLWQFNVCFNVWVVFRLVFAVPGGIGHASAAFEFSPNFSRVYIEFCQSLFSRSERLTYYVLKYGNFKSVEVQGWTPLKILIFCIKRWDLLSLRFSENAVLFHIEWLCRKTTGNVNRPPYRYTRVTHWACPLSSVPYGHV